MEMTPVVFRADKRGEFAGEVTAILPDMTCYAHVGQHSTYSDEWYQDVTRPATPEEYSALLTEIEGIYGPVRILQRRPQWFR